MFAREGRGQSNFSRAMRPQVDIKQDSWSLYTYALETIETSREPL